MGWRNCLNICFKNRLVNRPVNRRINCLIHGLENGLVAGGALGWILCCAAPVLAQALPNDNAARPSSDHATLHSAPSKSASASVKTAHRAQHGANQRPPKHAPRLNITGPQFQKNAAFWGLVDRMTEQSGLPRSWVERQLSKAHHLAQVKQLILPAATGTRKNWKAYRERFLNVQRIEWGQAFAAKHAVELQRAEEIYGVPGSIVTAILGVETLYGRHMGQYPALDALTTLALDFPLSHPRREERVKFFEGELAALLRLMNDPVLGQAPLLSSYAGAMGMAQFMPSNWQRFGVDFDGDGRVDLMHSPSDAIGSVAHYLQAYGWTKGLPTHYELSASDPTLQALPAGHLETLLAPDILPSFSAERLAQLGLDLSPAVRAHSGPLALVALENGDAANSYVLGSENFYVITRYNWSSYYAMAVIELSQEIKAAPLR